MTTDQTTRTERRHGFQPRDLGITSTPRRPLRLCSARLAGLEARAARGRQAARWSGGRVDAVSLEAAEMCARFGLGLGLPAVSVAARRDLGAELEAAELAAGTGPDAGRGLEPAPGEQTRAARTAATPTRGPDGQPAGKFISGPP